LAGVQGLPVEVRVMRKLSAVVLVMAAGISGLALVASATGTSAGGPTPRRLHVSRLEALALDGDRVAYDVAWIKASRKPKRAGHPNRVFVWNLRTGKTINVSGRRGTGADSNNPRVTLSQLAIAGTRVAWLTQSRFASPKGEDDLFASSVRRPKVGRVDQEVRNGHDCGKMVHGEVCPGVYLGGLVGAGNQIVVNRSATDQTGFETTGGLYALDGTRLKTLTTGGDTFWAVDVDQGRVAVLRNSQVYYEENVGLYSSTGAPLISVTPTAQAYQVALSGRNLAVVEAGAKLALYDADTGSLRKTFTLRGPTLWLWGTTFDVQGNIAVYAAGRSIRALNLSTGKDRLIGRLPHQITVAHIDSFGLVYANVGVYYARGFAGPIVFLPFKQVAAAVS
jgi:hypothetical protein